MIDKKRVPFLLGAVLVTALLAFLAKDALREPPIVRALPKARETLAPRPVSLPGGAIRDLGKPPGKLLVLHFWATWCPPCVEEFPSLVRFWKEYGRNPNVELLAVSVDEDWKTVDGWMKKVGAAGVPLALDPKRATARAFGTEKFPETYVLSSSGEVVEKFIGPIQWTSPAFRKEFDTLLRAVEAPAAPSEARGGG